jgi:hypothetical protein
MALHVSEPTERTMRKFAPFGIIAALLALTGAPVAHAEPNTPHIEWEVKNRFRLFRNEKDFQRHVAVHRGDGVLAAEQRLALASDGRGWAKDVLGHLCVDGTGKLVETCQRDGEKENYLSPEDHRVGVRLAGPAPAGATCAWNFDDSTPPPQQVTVPCTEEVRLRVRYGRTTVATVGITRPDNSVDSAAADIIVQDLLIAGLGDSVAAGEGNPDRPVALADDGFCFRRFLGSGEYFRPSRAGYQGNKACDDAAGGPEAAEASRDWERHAARWVSAACHHSLYGYQARTALALAVENPHVAVTFLPLACSGATMDAGIFKAQLARECPATGNCAGSVPGQITQLRDALARAQKSQPERSLDLVLLTVGANDIKFSGIVADVIITSGVERVLFQQSGLISSTAEAQRSLDRDVPAGFAQLRAALKPMVGGGMSRVACPWASIERRSNLGGSFARSLQSRPIHSAMSLSSAKRSASERTGASGAWTLAMATSDHQVSLRRSACGKSNSVASISAVSSVDTRSTQSKVWLRGRASRTAPVRRRIRPSMLARLDGATIGATVLRCAVWRGGSMRMKLGSSWPLGWSAIWMPPISEAEE